MSRRLIAVVVALVVAAAPSSAQVGSPAGGTPERPGYQFLRQNEDWSVLPALAAGDTDEFDPIKHVPLSDDGSVWASFGGDLRTRVEAWRDFAFGVTPGGVDRDDTFMLGRLRLHGDWHFGEDVRLFTEVKSALLTGRDLAGGVRAIDRDELEVQQLFCDLAIETGSGSRLTLRPGRQMIALGAQRLVSPLPWANSLRSWDGLTAVHRSDTWTVTGLALAFDPIEARELNEPDWDERLYGIHAARGRLELYVLGNENEDAAFNGTTGDERRQTLGVRLSGKLDDRTGYDVELDYQLGSVGDDDVSAWSVATELGWQISDPVRLAVGFDWASGDDEPGGDVGTFQQLYPLGHAYFGIADLIGRQNAIDLHLGPSWRPRPGVKVDLAAHSFWADSTGDAIYNAGGGVLRPGGSYDSDWIGAELDLSVSWRVDRHMTASAGYAHLFPGDAIGESGPDEDVDFLYFGTAFTF